MEVFNKSIHHRSLSSTSDDLLFAVFTDVYSR